VRFRAEGCTAQGAEIRWTIASSNKGTYMAARQSCSQRPSRATAVPWKRSLSERTNSVKNTSASPRAAKQAHAITGESVSSASSARQRGRNSRAKKPRAEAM
ncbi:Sporulation protein, partial [Dysosmobacter welbionis]